MAILRGACLGNGGKKSLPLVQCSTLPLQAQPLSVAALPGKSGPLVSRGRDWLTVRTFSLSGEVSVPWLAQPSWGPVTLEAHLTREVPGPSKPPNPGLCPWVEAGLAVYFLSYRL